MSKWSYYASSIPTLLGGVKNWSALVRLLALGRGPGPTRVDLRSGVRFDVRSLMDLWIVKETCLDRIYDEGESIFPPNAVMVDIGAGLGDFSIHFAHRYPSARVFAYEPFQESFILLEGNLALNRVTNVSPCRQAVGARTGILNLQTTTGIAVQHSTASTAGESFLRVDAVSLDDVFRQQGIARCDLLKVDCEGGEYDIFLHATDDTIVRIQRVAMEYHDGLTDHTHVELVDLFTRHGFAVRTQPNPVHRNIGMLYANRNIP
jgi:FkbM family methyltransferase